MSHAKKAVATARRRPVVRPAPPVEPSLAPALRLVVLWVAGAALLAGAARLLWQHVRDDTLAAGVYRLSPERIAITPQPAWIRADVKAEVIRDGSLDQALSLLDEKLLERVHAAFSLHPWVSEVVRVTKAFPARVEVELVYRQPVAMVEVDGGLLPVDAAGVVLPSDFTPLEAARYPRVGGIDSGPRGPVGTSWGDARIAEAAGIARVLGEHWEQLDLQKIVPAWDPASEAPARFGEYDVVVRSGARLPWGRPPGTEAPGEPSTAEKVREMMSAER